MNKGFSFYFKKGWNLSFFALKKVKFSERISLSLYLLTSCVAKFIFFLRPLFVVADNNLAAMIEHAHGFSIQKAFEGAGKKYWNLLVSYLAIDAIMFTTAALILIPYWVSKNSNFFPTIKNVASIPFLALLTVFLIVYPLGYTAVGYLAYAGKDLQVGDYLYNSKYSMKRNKGTAFLIELVTELIIVVPLALIIFFTVQFNKAGSYISNIVALCLVVVAIILYFVIFDKMLLVKNQATFLLCEDITVLKKSVVVVKQSGEDDSKYVPLFPDQNSVVIPLDNFKSEQKEEAK